MVDIGVDGGPTRTRLLRLGRQYAAVGRTVVTVVTVLLGTFGVPATAPVVPVAVGGLVLAWSAVYVAWLCLRPITGVFVACDVAVVAVAATTARWTVPAAAITEGGGGWVIVYASVSAVALQVVTTVRQGMLAVAAIDAALLVGVAISPGGLAGAAVAIPAWVLVEAALTRLLWRLVQRAADTADTSIAGSALARREVAVSAARRAQERAYCATLHDTAATTLLMVGLGEVRSDAPWLRGQAERDLRALAGAPAPGRQAVACDLGSALTALADEQSAVTVRRHLQATDLVTPAVAQAVCGAVREALNNVARHSGAAEAVLRARMAGMCVVVELTDSGRGFDPAEVSSTSHGIARSIEARMADVGGRATVRSAPGRGTTVRVEWQAG